jgi:ketosteroid isomerase-like protein
MLMPDLKEPSMTYQSTDQQQVTELEYRFIEACLTGDTEVLARILADDFIFTDPNGVNLTKREWLTGISSSDFRFESIEVEAVQVSVREELATVGADLKVKAQSKKAWYDGKYSALDIYEKRAGRWQMTLSTANRVKA